MQKYIITGGPGAGKSTLLNALHQQGYPVSEEVSRVIIIEEHTKAGNCLPWVDLSCFAQKALARMVHNYQHTATTPYTTFFDRGIPDILAYLKDAKHPIAPAYIQAVNDYRYNPLVFLAPPWEEIYVNDSERWQTFEEAAALFHAIKETYLSFNYTLLQLPKTSVEERVNFILSHI
ncbi:AAA family ATPase [Anditalea andensis]|uniref:NadR/Ttd14 AAA domain-containing protein n=1 Tax=Anditalea andensis TaxID=1048983 RepID=A0A074KXL9_9BACT|nr:AAA family ATPase [Anditalea andensis]KEO72960.1 hypothetical protein EL17_15185 [Anditalea andensis]